MIHTTERLLRLKLVGSLVIMIFAGCGVQQTAEVKIPPVQTPVVESHEPEIQSIEQQWGIEVQGVSLSAAGYMLDFRYKVVDPVKAAPVLKRPAESYLIDQASGRKMIVPRPPKVGSLRQTTLKPEAGRTYFVIFANPGKFVKPGNKITIAIGEMRLKDIVVN